MEKDLNPKTRGLGRGLNALFGDEEDFPPSTSGDKNSADGTENSAQSGRKRQILGVEQMAPGQFQPRQVFDDEALEQLADSIKGHGVLQPIVVRAHKDEANRYEIIAGERRWRAAQKAQIHEVPVIILDISDVEAMEIALIENLQREDLNAVEEAVAYKKLMDDYGHTQEKLGTSLGKSRSHIANTVRLLSLPESVLNSVQKGELSAGHARALVTMDNPESLAREIIAKGLNVRQTENLVSKGHKPAQKKRGSARKIKKDVDTIAMENDMSLALGMRVSIDTPDNKAGKITVEFQSLDQLQELIARLLTPPPTQASARLTE